MSVTQGRRISGSTLALASVLQQVIQTNMSSLFEGAHICAKGYEAISKIWPLDLAL